IEWGKRKKNYSEKGKDPSNVWIPTEDDGKGKITKHVFLDIEGVLNRIYKAFNKSSETTWFLNTQETNFDDIISVFKNENIIFEDLNYIDNDKVLNELDFGAPILKSLKNIEIIYDTSEEMNIESKVKTIVTSPPYWDLKNYFKDGQIGHESYE